MTTATAFTISHTTEQDLLAGLETEFNSYRSRIALLSVEAIGTITDMFTPLGPVATDVIDLGAIEAIEWAQFERDLAPVETDAVVLEFAA